MSEQIKDGGPAFPKPGWINLNEDSENYGSISCGDGMTLRDWFAGMALQGIIAADYHDIKCISDLNYAAGHAYMFADQMISGREKVKE